MSEASIQTLERDVEAARAKLAGDLATLRAPATYSEFTSNLKGEAFDLKDALVEKAKVTAQSTFQNLIDDVKSRAAANPAAALAIGAGIAWRFVTHPPIATALVGAGLYSLFRTPPARPVPPGEFLTRARTRLGEQAADFAGTVKEQALELSDTASTKVTELASDAVDRATAVGEGVKDQVSQLAGSVKERAQQWTAAAQTTAREVGSEAAQAIERTAGAGNLRDTATNGAHRARAIAEDWTRPAKEMIEDPDSRDKLLLGTAVLAVIGAVGIACQRRLGEPAG